MTVIVAYRAPDGTLVFGADQKCTSPDGDHFARKLSFHPTNQGNALMGMAADDVICGYALQTDLRIALNRTDLSRNPVEDIQSELCRLRSGDVCDSASGDVEILLGIGSLALPQPKLMGIANREIKDLGDTPFCCIGSGRGAAGGFLKLVSGRLCDLRMVEAAVCIAVWLAKRSDSLCGGDTNIICLHADARREEVEEKRIKAFESSIATSLSNNVAQWMANTPF